MKKLLVVLLLTGCAQPQPKPQGSMYDAAARECEAFGFEKGTEAYGNCMQREVQSRREMALKYLLRR
jgi:hypothetical protein